MAPFNKPSGFNDITFGAGGRLVAVKVIDIILDSNHPDYEKYGGPESIGTILFNRVEQENRYLAFPSNPDHMDREELHITEDYAKPFFSHIKYYPLKNEVVTCITLPSAKSLVSRLDTQHFYFPTLNLWNHPHANTFAAIQNYKAGETSNTSTNIDYQQEGLERKEPSDDEIINSQPINVPLGLYFNERFDIRPLLPYEGDNILEGRFGNSIRLGATARGVEENSEMDQEKYEFPTGSLSPWSKGGATENGDPITIIRNGQPKELTTEEDISRDGETHIFEDINLDPSSIYLTSTQNIETFQVAAPDCWYSFGQNVVIKPETVKTATDVVNDPSEMYDKEQGSPTVEGKETASSKECPEGQIWSEELQACVLPEVTVSGTGSLAEENTTGSISENDAGLNEDEVEASRYYDTPIEPEKEAIDGNLPEAYRLSDLEDVPYYYQSFKGEGLTNEWVDTHYYNRAESEQGKSRCENCAFFKAGSNVNDNQCSKWNAKVRRNWYCASYANGLLDKLKNYPNFGVKHFTIKSPDPYVGRKGYLKHFINVGGNSQEIELTVVSTEFNSGDSSYKKSPPFPLSTLPENIVKGFINNFLHEIIIPKTTKGLLHVEFDDSSFGVKVGLTDPPPPPPAGPFDYFLGPNYSNPNKNKLGLDLYNVAGVGRARNGGQAHKSKEIKEDSKQKALKLIWNSHPILHHKNAFDGNFEDFKEVTTIEAVQQLDAYNYPALTKPISNKEWSVGYQWKIKEIYWYYTPE